MLENQCWQPLDGLEGALIFPIIRKPDIDSSNAYILHLSDHVVIIDSGADSVQSQRVVSIIDELSSNHQKPVILMITHCHVDHCLHAMRIKQEAATGSINLAIHKEGMEILSNRDNPLTLAGLLDIQFPPTIPDITLLEGGCDVSREITLINASPIHALCSEIDTGASKPIKSEKLCLSSSESIEIFHTPGHSPDSICILIGSMLFIGDLFAATSPFVAGVAGWDKEDLITTYEHLQWVLNNIEVSVCLPGHGRAVSASSAKRIISSLITEAVRMQDCLSIDKQRIDEAADYSLEVLKEIREGFSIIAGRLYYLSLWLEELEEPEVALRWINSIDLQGIDSQISAFEGFLEDYIQGKKLKVQVLHKALQVIGRINDLIRKNGVERFIDKSITARVSRLLADFTADLRGGLKADRSNADINRLMAEIVEGTKGRVYEAANLFQSIDSVDAFADSLAEHIAYVNVFEDVNVHLDSHINPVISTISLQRFAEAVRFFLEDLAGFGNKDIHISLKDEGIPVLKIEIEDKGKVSERSLRFHSMRFRLCGCELTFIDLSGVGIFEIALPGPV